jgi:DNA-binding MarR family transcriptional regulator
MMQNAEVSHEPEPLYDVVRRIRPLNRLLVASVDDRLDGTGVTIGTRGVMEQLADGGPQTVPQIARALGVGRQFIQRVVDAAVAEGLLELELNPVHLRSSLVELTPHGRATFRRLFAEEQRVLRRAVLRLDPRDVRACIKVLDHLTRAFDEVVRRGKQRG